MDKKNTVFIATSLDGYIADKSGGITWLNSIPNPNNNDVGYSDFIQKVDAIVMGRSTFETVCNFNIPWPYDKPVFVLSNTLNKIPEKQEGKAFLMKGILSEILKLVHKKGYTRLYIDGGITIQNFLKADLIDEMYITTLPILLGGGIPLFADLPKKMKFERINSKIFLDQITQNHYKRKR